MNRSVLFQVAALMTLVTSLVAVIMLYLLPGRQEAALERSVLDELSGLSLAYSISVRSALEQEDLAALAELNEQVASDPRSPIIAILSEKTTHKVFSLFSLRMRMLSLLTIFTRISFFRLSDVLVPIFSREPWLFYSNAKHSNLGSTR